MSCVLFKEQCQASLYRVERGEGGGREGREGGGGGGEYIP